MNMTAIEFANDLWQGTPDSVNSARELALGYIRTTELPETHKPYLAQAMYIIVMAYLETAVRNHERIDVQKCVSKSIEAANNVAEIPFPHGESAVRAILMFDLTTYARRAIELIREGYRCAV